MSFIGRVLKIYLSEIRSIIYGFFRTYQKLYDDCQAISIKIFHQDLQISVNPADNGARIGMYRLHLIRRYIPIDLSNYLLVELES